MINDRETITKHEKPSIRKLEQRLIFVSHTHADRKLAAEVRTLIEESFSGVVRAYVSSDPTPTGGLQPGDEWYEEIHRQLRAAESVWVMATRTSIERPWIYWEAGIGKAACPGAVVVLRVGLSSNELPSPLSNFQSYDGLVDEDGGVGELLGKVANQIGMNLSPILIKATAERWIKAAKRHKPETEGQTPSPQLSPEQLDQFGALIARLEAVVDLTRAAPPVRPAREVALPPSRRREAQVAARREADERLARVVGNSTLIYEKVDRLVETIDGAPSGTTFQFSHIDGDGDARIDATRDSETVHIYLHSEALISFEAPAGGSTAARALISKIKEAFDSEEEQ